LKEKFVKLFYFISLGVVGLMTLSPLWLLRRDGGERFERVIARYTETGVPVWNDNPVVRRDSFGGAVRSIDPTTCGDTTSADIQGNFYEGLYSYHYLLLDEGRPVLIPSLARSMPRVSKDGLTYTIKLKRGVKYHRNPCFGLLNAEVYKTRTVRAEDFVLAFKRVADYHNSNTSISWAFLAGRIVGLDAYRAKTKKYAAGDFSRYSLPVEGLRALDDLTLQIRLTKPYPQFTKVLAMGVYAPCPAEAVDYWLTGLGKIPQAQRNVEFREAKMVVGTGAYLLHTFKRKNKIILVRNPDYRPVYYPSKGSPGDGQAGLLADAGKRVPFIDVIDLDFVAESYSAWMLFLSRRSDASGIPREAFESVITPGRDLTATWRKKHIYLRKVWQPSVYWFVFNMEDKLLGASPALRQAMCLSYDVESQIRILSNGRGRHARNVVPASFKGNKEAGPGPYFRFDPAEAKKKIAQAKQELASKGLLDAQGEIPPITVELGDHIGARRMAEFARQQFARIGVRIKAVFNDWPTLQQKVHSKHAQMYTMGWHADYYDAENFLQLFYSPNIKKGTNNSNYSNPQFDKLYEQIRTMPDSPQRTAIYAKMIRMIGQDCPVLTLSEPLTLVLYYDWYKNVKLHPIGYGFGKYRRIDTALRKKLGGR